MGRRRSIQRSPQVDDNESGTIFLLGRFEIIDVGCRIIGGTYYILCGSEDLKTNYDPCPAGYRLPSEKSWGNFFSDLKILEDESGATYTYKGKTAWYPAMNNGRMFDTGENIKGFPAFTVWNCSYMIADPMGILDMNPPYSMEELIEMGLIISAPQRAYMQYNNMQDVVNAHFAVANPSFAFAVRCVKE